MEPAAALAVQGLTKSYRGGRIRALDGVSLEVKPNEVFGIIGPNGAGKTTLMACLLGLLRPDSGSIQFAEGEPDNLGVRSVTGYLPERLNFDRWMSGWKFVAYHHELAGRSQQIRGQEVTDALQRVGLASNAWDAPIRSYSRGMLQRVGLAQAILGPPKYLLLDEPSSGVDPAGIIQIRNVLIDLKKAGVTIILNSHQLDQVERVCDRVALVRSGRVESIEDLKSADKGARTLQVQWVSAPSEPQARASAVAQSAGGAMVQFDDNSGTFAVPDEQSAAALVRGLTEAGFGVVGVTTAESRLERHFVGSREGRA